MPPPGREALSSRAAFWARSCFSGWDFPCPAAGPVNPGWRRRQRQILGSPFGRVIRPAKSFASGVLPSWGGWQRAELAPKGEVSPSLGELFPRGGPAGGLGGVPAPAFGARGGGNGSVCEGSGLDPLPPGAALPAASRRLPGPSPPSEASVSSRHRPPKKQNGGGPPPGPDPAASELRSPRWLCPRRTGWGGERARCRDGGGPAAKDSRLPIRS